MNVETNMLSILNEMFGIHLTKEEYDLNFFGKELGLQARNLIDFLFELERRLGVEITEEDIWDKRICTFSGLLRACNKKL